MLDSTSTVVRFGAFFVFQIRCISIFVLMLAVTGVSANANSQSKNIAPFEIFIKRIFHDIELYDCSKLNSAEYNDCYSTQLYIARTSTKFVSAMALSYSNDIFRRFERFSVLRDYVDPGHITKTSDVFSQYAFLESDEDINALADCLASYCGKWVNFSHHTSKSWAAIFEKSLDYIMCNLNEKRIAQKVDEDRHWPNLFSDARNGRVPACSHLNVPDETYAIVDRLYAVGHHRDIFSRKFMTEKGR